MLVAFLYRDYNDLIFHLFAFLFNLGSKEEGDIVECTDEMLLTYDENITVATAKDVEEAFATINIGGGSVKYILNSVCNYIS